MRKARYLWGFNHKESKVVNRGEDITVCLPGIKIEDVLEKTGQIMSCGTGEDVLLHVGTNNAEKEERRSSLVSTRGWSHLKRHGLGMLQLQEDDGQHISTEGMYGGRTR